MSLNNIEIGVDIENIARFQKQSFLKNRSLLTKIYTKLELDYAFSKKNPAQHLAARFAAKEAAIKTLTNLTPLFIQRHEIEITHNQKGVPLIKICRLPNFNFKLSLSHSQTQALAFVVAIKNNKTKNTKK
ncbi:MAG: peptide transporter [Candidatus Levybacteria bacterium CG10_big_fil_rev_8_21_14_0_10_36_7]|nr:MAG: peptide transporter [Candidatus Levybacteria bacterium CG10_big_fil_rev_8_21_14_0_10_36_7]